MTSMTHSAHCQPFTAQTSDRRACMVPLWIAPPQKRVPES